MVSSCVEAKGALHSHPYRNPSAGPSSSSSPRFVSIDSTTQDTGVHGRPVGTGREIDEQRFDDAEDEEFQDEAINSRVDMTGFQPPPPRSMPYGQHAVHLYPSPSSQSHSSDPAYNTLPTLYMDTDSPSTSVNPETTLKMSPRDRLPSSTSMSSTSSGTGKRRAPVPTALTLSPQSDKKSKEDNGLGSDQEAVHQMNSLGYGYGSGSFLTEARRAVTDSYAESVSNVSLKSLVPLT